MGSARGKKRYALPFDHKLRAVKFYLEEQYPAKAISQEMGMSEKPFLPGFKKYTMRPSFYLVFKLLYFFIFRFLSFCSLTHTSHRVSLRKEANDCRCEACGQTDVKVRRRRIKEFFFA